MESKINQSVVSHRSNRDDNYLAGVENSKDKINPIDV
jgi:hypothetical protein